MVAPIYLQCADEVSYTPQTKTYTIDMGLRSENLPLNVSKEDQEVAAWSTKGNQYLTLYVYSAPPILVS
jgi:hypothetical protein